MEIDVNDAVAFILSKLNVAYIIRHVKREERAELPEEALREAVVNALAHRDYRSTANVQVYIFKDRVEIVSPGGLPTGMTVANLGVKSVPRNPLLFGMLHRMSAVDHIGPGIPRMRMQCREYRVPEPKIEVSEHWFAISFTRPTVTDATGGPESQPESIEVRVLALLAKSPISKSDMSKGLGRKSVLGQLNKVVRHLLDEGMIAYTLPGKPASRFQKYNITAKGRTVIDSLGKSQ